MTDSSGLAPAPARSLIQLPARVQSHFLHKFAATSADDSNNMAQAARRQQRQLLICNAGAVPRPPPPYPRTDFFGRPFFLAFLFVSRRRRRRLPDIFVCCTAKCEKVAINFVSVAFNGPASCSTEHRARGVEGPRFSHCVCSIHLINFN